MENDARMEQIMDWLAGELDPLQEQELLAAFARDADFAAHARELQRLWQALEDAVPPVRDEASLVERVYLRIVFGDASDALTDEDLDIAAGGVQASDQKWPGSPNDTDD